MLQWFIWVQTIVWISNNSSRNPSSNNRHSVPLGNIVKSESPDRMFILLCDWHSLPPSWFERSDLPPLPISGASSPFRNRRPSRAGFLSACTEKQAQSTMAFTELCLTALKPWNCSHKACNSLRLFSTLVQTSSDVVCNISVFCPVPVGKLIDCYFSTEFPLFTNAENTALIRLGASGEMYSGKVSQLWDTLSLCEGIVIATVVSQRPFGKYSLWHRLKTLGRIWQC